MKRLSPHTFRNIIYGYYRRHGRSFPWRMTRNPYHILISEVMLQQTQTERVVEKYQQFITIFPTWDALARAPLRKVLSVWQGLGYNRRALALKTIARRVMQEWKGVLPSGEQILRTLPYIGRTTAAAVAAFVFEKPTLLIETNIRRVFLHFFFRHKRKVEDREIFPLLQKTLDSKNPRLWYYALMDYGAMLKKQVSNPNRKSMHYRTQSPFQNSNRQLRGAIIRTILARHRVALRELSTVLHIPAAPIYKNLIRLEKEGLLKKRAGYFKVA